MEALPARWGAAIRRRAGEADWAGVAVWALACGLVVLLGLEGGGFDPLVHGPVGIAVWWLLLAGVLVGALPLRRLSGLAWAALGLFAAFAAWTALSLAWTESPDKTWAEVARVTGYLGVFALALCARGRRGARRLVTAVGAGVAVVALVALLSRLQPGWFPGAAETGGFLARERLAFPIDYWNALAALIAIGSPALLYAAACARSPVARGAAGAALPMMALAAFLTLGRGGIAAAILAPAVFLAFAPDRLPKLAALLAAASGGAALIVAVLDREALREGLTGPVAQRQGDELTVLTIAVCLVVGLAQVGLSLAFAERRRPRWTRVRRRPARVTAAASIVLALVAGLAFGAPGRAGDAWEEFKSSENPGRGVERLTSTAGLARYDFWASAVDQSATRPVSGAGAGSFEYWWAREATVSGTIRDAHSLYFQTLGELGIVGFALLVGFVLLVLVGGVRETVRASPRARPQLAAALAGCLAFALTAGFDWHWQIPVLPVAFLLLASVLVGSGARPRRSVEGDSDARRPALRLAVRLGFAIVGLAAITAIAIPLTTAGLLRASEEDARSGDLGSALEAARSAQNVQPSTAGPRLQQALVLEEAGDLPAAAAAVRAATEREETNWRNWLVLARIEAERGRAAAAIRAYRRARSLNPRHSLFVR